MRYPYHLSTVRLAAVVLLLTLCGTAAAQIPETLNYQGYLTDTDGKALDGAFDLTFRLYDQLRDGNALWTEERSDVTLSSGVFSVRRSIRRQ